MPVSGCPQAHFTWQTGWRYQDTEDKTPSNGRSDSLHIEGSVGFSSVNKSFCMKMNTSQDSSLQKTWPKGKSLIPLTLYWASCVPSAIQEAQQSYLKGM